MGQVYLQLIRAMQKKRATSPTVLKGEKSFTQLHTTVSAAPNTLLSSSTSASAPTLTSLSLSLLTTYPCITIFITATPTPVSTKFVLNACTDRLSALIH